MCTRQLTVTNIPVISDSVSDPGNAFCDEISRIGGVDSRDQYYNQESQNNEFIF